MNHRDIKFRVWHKKQNRWLDPYAEEDPYMDLFGGVYTYDRGRKGWTNLFTLPPDIVVQQYTGMKDKNQLEIYEGDLVSYNEKFYYIVWAKAYSGYQFCMIDSKGDMSDFYGGIHFPEEREIVGNIFENPEENNLEA